jgi:hypothetical protein
MNSARGYHNFSLFISSSYHPFFYTIPIPFFLVRVVMRILNWSLRTPITIITLSVPKSPMSISKADSVDSMSAQIDTTTPNSTPSMSSEGEQPLLALEAVPCLGAVDSLRKALGASVSGTVPLSRKRKLENSLYEVSLYENEDGLSRIEEEMGPVGRSQPSSSETPAWNDLPATPLSMAVDASADDPHASDLFGPTTSLEYALYGHVSGESVTPPVLPSVQSITDFPSSGHEAAPMSISKAEHLPRLVNHGGTRTKHNSFERMEPPRIEVYSPRDSVSVYEKARRTFMGTSSNLSDPFHDSQWLSNDSRPETPGMVTPPESPRRNLDRFGNGTSFDGPANDDEDDAENGADKVEERSIDGCFVSACDANKLPLYLDYSTSVAQPEVSVTDTVTDAVGSTKVPSADIDDLQSADNTLSSHAVDEQSVDQTPPKKKPMLDYFKKQGPPKEPQPADKTVSNHDVDEQPVDQTLPKKKHMLDYFKKHGSPKESRLADKTVSTHDVDEQSVDQPPPKENLLLDYSKMQGPSKEPHSVHQTPPQFMLGYSEIQGPSKEPHSAHQTPKQENLKLDSSKKQSPSEEPQQADQTSPPKKPMLDYSEMQGPSKEPQKVHQTPPKQNIKLDYFKSQDQPKDPQVAVTGGTSLPFSQPTETTGEATVPTTPTEEGKPLLKKHHSANKSVRKARKMLLRKPILAAIVGRQLAGPTKEKLRQAASDSEATEPILEQTAATV